MAPVTLPDRRVPVVLSAHADDLVRADAAAILRYLERHPAVPAVAGALLRTRGLRRHRAVVRAADLSELTDGLTALAAGQDHPLVARSAESVSPRTAFVFPGGGGQWAAMGAEAYRQSPIYRGHADRCAAEFVAAGAPSPLPYLADAAHVPLGSQLELQAAQFTHAVAVAAVWRAGGIAPDITVGHSLGEVAAAYVAGTVTLADAVAVVIARASVLDGLPGDYSVAVLGVGVDDARGLLAQVDGWLEVSVVNTGASVAVAGERPAIAALLRLAGGHGVFARELDMNFPAHTSILEPLHDDLLALLPGGRFGDAPIPFIAAATGSTVAAGTDFADHWYANLRATVRFDRAVAAARQQGANAFIEVSAHPSLLFALGELCGDSDGAPLVVGSGHRDVPWVDALSANIAAAAIADPAYRWADLVDADGPPLRGFPNAPMRAVRLWALPTPKSAPVPGLTVAEERWEPKTLLAEENPATRIAVVQLGQTAGALAARLRDAVERHPVARPAAAENAELLAVVAPMLDQPDAQRAVPEIARLLDSGLLDYVTGAGPACRQICLVTVRGEQVRPDDPAALPAQAALAAVHRSIGFEHPDQRFRHLDLPSWDVDATTAAAAVDALCSDVPEAAIRAGAATYVRHFAELGSPPPWRLTDGLLDDVVITGGSGAVGVRFARYVAERGARRIVLLSRRGVADAVLADLSRHTEIVAPQCDLTSAEDVRSAALAHGGAGASLIVHTAATATFADRAAVTAHAFIDTAAAKVGGLARMAELWPMRADTRILVCSSVSGVWGGRGHAAYAAANRMLEVLAGRLRAEGRHCRAVRYGLWSGRGIADAAQVARIERSGLVPMDPHTAIAAGLSELPDGALVFSANRDRLDVFLDRAAEDETATDTDAFDLTTCVRSELARVLRVADATTVDLATSLLDLGVDSLLALDLRKRLRRATGTSVPLATLLGGITGAELIASLRPEKVDTSRDRHR